jgi:hypothetical protein
MPTFGAVFPFPPVILTFPLRLVWPKAQRSMHERSKMGTFPEPSKNRCSIGREIMVLVCVKNKRQTANKGISCSFYGKRHGGRRCHCRALLAHLAEECATASWSGCAATYPMTQLSLTSKVRRISFASNTREFPSLLNAWPGSQNRSKRHT